MTRDYRWLTSIGWGVMALLAIVIAVDAGRYLRLDPSYYFSKQREVFSTN